MAVWMPVTVVPRSLATDLMETFMTEESRVMRNWPEANTSSTADPVLAAPPPPPSAFDVPVTPVTPPPPCPDGEKTGRRAGDGVSSSRGIGVRACGRTYSGWPVCGPIDDEHGDRQPAGGPLGCRDQSGQR